MMKETNKAVAGEASRSNRRRKRQRLPSVAEIEGRETASVDDGDEVIPEARSGTLLDLDLLDCPVCFQALTQHVYQVLVSLIRYKVCTKKFSYGKVLAHEKECPFVLCYCPKPNCNYAGVYKDLYSDYDANHKNTSMVFVCGRLHSIYLLTEFPISVLQECRGGPLVVVQCFEVAQGLSFTVNCIAPSAPGVGKLSFDLTYTMGRHTVTFGSTEMNMIQKVSFQTPEDDFMSIPSYLNPMAILTNLCIRIRRLEEEEAGEEEAGGGEDEEEEAVEVDVINNVRRSAREKKSNSKYQNKVK